MRNKTTDENAALRTGRDATNSIRAYPAAWMKLFQQCEERGAETNDFWAQSEAELLAYSLRLYKQSSSRIQSPAELNPN